MLNNEHNDHILQYTLAPVCNLFVIIFYDMSLKTYIFRILQDVIMFYVAFSRTGSYCLQSSEQVNMTYFDYNSLGQYIVEWENCTRAFYDTKVWYL